MQISVPSGLFAEPELKVSGPCRAGETRSQCVMYWLPGFVRCSKMLAGLDAGPARLGAVSAWARARLLEIFVAYVIPIDLV